jgi:hypothetical protein
MLAAAPFGGVKSERKAQKKVSDAIQRTKTTNGNRYEIPSDSYLQTKGFSRTLAP